MSGKSHTYTTPSENKNRDLNCVHILEEVTLRVRGMHAPPVVGEYIEDAE
jgi:hypothetical protein